MAGCWDCVNGPLGCIKRRGILWLAEEVFEELYCMEMFITF